MSSGTQTATMPLYQHTYSPLSGSGMLSSSMSSLAGNRHQASQIAKTYRQAAQLFLTRRLPEALSTIEPVITPQPAEQTDGEQSGEERTLPLAPIAAVSKGTRVKVWSFYLTFLNSVVELGPDEGKHAFGSTKWRALVNKARDGSVWEDVVRDGYGGNEGAVDPDVVINLATLLLTHSPDQQRTQTRLETYLASLSHPTFDITTSQLSRSKPGVHRQASGTNTPRDLHTHLKLLELYTLHVLPRNGEWDYAREFILMSEHLDDERKEAFLQALHGLREEQDAAAAAARERDLAHQQQAQLEAQRRREQDEQRLEAERRRDEARRRPPDVSPAHSATSSSPPKPAAAAARQNGAATPSRQARTGTPRRPQPKPQPQPSPSPSPSMSASLATRASAVVSALRTVALDAAHGLRHGSFPLPLLRTLLFVLALALALARRDLRERLRRAVARAWESLRRTVGMGVKVSYV